MRKAVHWCLNWKHKVEGDKENTFGSFNLVLAFVHSVTGGLRFTGIFTSSNADFWSAVCVWYVLVLWTQAELVNCPLGSLKTSLGLVGMGEFKVACQG